MCVCCMVSGGAPDQSRCAPLGWLHGAATRRSSAAFGRRQSPVRSVVIHSLITAHGAPPHSVFCQGGPSPVHKAMGCPLLGLGFVDCFSAERMEDAAWPAAVPSHRRRDDQGWWGGIHVTRAARRVVVDGWELEGDKHGHQPTHLKKFPTFFPRLLSSQPGNISSRQSKLAKLPHRPVPWARISPLLSSLSRLPFWLRRCQKPCQKPCRPSTQKHPFPVCLLAASAPIYSFLGIVCLLFVFHCLGLIYLGSFWAIWHRFSV